MQEFSDINDVPAHEIERRLIEKVGGGERGLADDARAGARWAAAHWREIVRVLRDLEDVVAGDEPSAGDDGP